MSKELAVRDTREVGIFSTPENFEQSIKMAEVLSKSDLLPRSYRDNPANTLITMEMASRFGVSLFTLAQNMDIIEGRPAFASKFIIGAINSSGKYTSSLDFITEDLGEKEVVYEYWTGPKENRRKVEAKVRIQNLTCKAWAIEKSSGLKKVGPAVSMEMAVQEGWYGKNGSKWKTMPEVMLAYRAASFFRSRHCPEILSGMQSNEEVIDAEYTVTQDDTVQEIPTITVPIAAPVEDIKPRRTRKTVTDVVEPAPADEPHREPTHQPAPVTEKPLPPIVDPTVAIPTPPKDEEPDGFASFGG